MKSAKLGVWGSGRGTQPFPLFSDSQIFFTEESVRLIAENTRERCHSFWWKWNSVEECLRHGIIIIIKHKEDSCDLSHNSESVFAILSLCLIILSFPSKFWFYISHFCFCIIKVIATFILFFLHFLLNLLFLKWQKSCRDSMTQIYYFLFIYFSSQKCELTSVYSDFIYHNSDFFPSKL